MDLNPVSGEQSAPAAASSSSKAKKDGTSGAAVASNEPVLDPRRSGSIHFMGNVTKKLVITPDYEIGTKKSKVSTANGGGAAEKKSAGRMTAASRQQQQQQEEEQEEDVDDVIYE